MFKKIVSILAFRKKGNTASSDINKDDDAIDQAIVDEYVYRYPPFPKGLSAAPIETILRSNQEIIQQIILARGLAGKHNENDVEVKVLAPIRHLAETVHLLPASEKNHFRTPGGLFRFSLESALFCLRYSERRILTHVTPEIRRESEALWAHAAFLTGLFSESVLVISRISVYSEEGGIEWHPGTESIFQWIRRNQLKSYHIRWSAKEDRPMVYALAGKVIQTEQAEILAQGEKSIYKTLFSALHDQEDLNNPLVKINRSVKYKLIERDEASDPSRYGKPLTGMHLDPWLIDAMRHLVEKKRWVVNDENGRLWHGNDGVYLVWPLAAGDMQHELKEAESPFVPNTKEILAELMLEAGIIDHDGVDKDYLFDIAIPQSDSADRKHVTAIRLVRHEILFERIEYKPLDINLQINFAGEEIDNISRGAQEVEVVDYEFDAERVEPVREKAVLSKPEKTVHDPISDLSGAGTVRANKTKAPVSSADLTRTNDADMSILFGNKEKGSGAKDDVFVDLSPKAAIANQYDAEYAEGYLYREPVGYENFPEELVSGSVSVIPAFGLAQQIADPVISIKEVNKVTSVMAKAENNEHKVNVGHDSHLCSYLHPPLVLLKVPENRVKGHTKNELDEISRLVEAILQNFNLEVKVVEVHPGPVITMFELQLAVGVKVSRISNLDKDIARALSVNSVRIVEVIPGKSVIGLEIPNKEQEIVWLQELLVSPSFRKAESVLTMAVGKDIYGDPMIIDLGGLPHALIAGTTGSGKSVAINTMILSLLYKATPEQVRLIMIDPKMLELSVYEDIPHLWMPVVTDMTEAKDALQKAVDEMERRYKLMSKIGAKHLTGFNKILQNAEDQGRPIRDPLFENEQDESNEASLLSMLPFIVIIIDELADMMMVDKKVEGLIVRLAQKARAAGIHLILATQRPSSDVLTGLIKANIPARFSFQVTSKMDSRTVLDQNGAEMLLGNGDMLFLPSGSTIPLRAHGAFVDDLEIRRLVEFLKNPSDEWYLSDEWYQNDSSSLDEAFSGDIVDGYHGSSTNKEIPKTSSGIPAIDRKENSVDTNNIGKATITESKGFDAEKAESAGVEKTNAELLNGLFGMSDDERNKQPPKPPPQDKENLHARSGLVLNKLKTMPVSQMEGMPGGVTKVLVKGLKDIDMDLKDCVSVLRAADLLILVDGLETGLDSSRKKQSQYFLVKGDLLDGR